MGDDPNPADPWLPPPIIAVLVVASIVAAAVGFVALVDSPAAAMAALRDPAFYVFLAVGGGTAVVALFAQNR
jgi:hypothetical protein